MLDLSKLSGGQKRMWINQNWSEIESYYRRNGFEATRQKFHMKVETLERNLRDVRGIKKGKREVSDKRDVKLEMLRSEIAELRGEVRKMKDDHSLFVESVADQVKVGFLIPLLRSGIKPPEELDIKFRADQLRIDIVGDTIKIGKNEGG